MVLPTQSPLLLLATALNASAALTLQVEAYQVDSPPRPLPKSLSSRSRDSRAACKRSGRSSATRLRAYTVADTSHDKSWLPIFKFPTSFADLTSQFGTEDSLYSFEGGGAAEVAVKPSMPNLELEAAAIMATKEKDANLNMETDELLLLELNSLTSKFEELQSSMDYKSQLYSATINEYEYKTSILVDKNALLEEGLNVLTTNLEEQEQQLKEFQQEREHYTEKETNRVNENEMLRLRLRELELAQSDAAFLSRKVVAPIPSIKEPSKTESVNKTRLSPKAPSAPVPSHIYQQRQVEQVQLKVEEYKREQSSALKSFRLGVGRGAKNVGRALNLWSPLYNVLMWGELKGN